MRNCRGRQVRSKKDRVAIVSADDLRGTHKTKKGEKYTRKAVERGIIPLIACPLLANVYGHLKETREIMQINIIPIF